MLNALIVIYNKSCIESTTFKFISNYSKKINIIVFDNSTIDYGNKEYCEANGISYYTVNKNIGLSRAYNFVLNKIKLDKSDYLLILDDDTTLNDEYIKEVLESINENNADILLPIVMSNKKIISPSNIQFECRVKQIENLDEINLNKITAINSGMVVRTSVYNYVLYNEDMFLDYVDHDFMSKIREKRMKIKILNSKINQNFSRDEVKSKEQFNFRYKIYKKDFKIYCKTRRRMLYYYINIIKYKVTNCLKTWR